MKLYTLILAVVAAIAWAMVAHADTTDPFRCRFTGFNVETTIQVPAGQSTLETVITDPITKLQYKLVAAHSSYGEWAFRQDSTEIRLETWQHEGGDKVLVSTKATGQNRSIEVSYPAGEATIRCQKGY